MPALVAYRMFQHAAARRRLDKFYLWAVKVNSFNTQPPEGGWISNTMSVYTSACFNTQPPEGGWFFTASMRLAFSWFQHAAARRRLGMPDMAMPTSVAVSTRSRPKAAGKYGTVLATLVSGFNTQPPEGGWFEVSSIFFESSSFNTQPPEGGWMPYFMIHGGNNMVSTRSRPKAAGFLLFGIQQISYCFNTQPPEGGWLNNQQTNHAELMFQHAAARRRLGRHNIRGRAFQAFQHAAARRRLVCSAMSSINRIGFNTQPPEGGWLVRGVRLLRMDGFQHAAARRRLVYLLLLFLNHQTVSTRSRPKAAGKTEAKRMEAKVFQHAAARRRLGVNGFLFFMDILVSTRSRPKAAGNV